MQTVAWAAKGRGGGEQAEPNELHYITEQYVCVYACVCVRLMGGWASCPLKSFGSLLWA